MIEAPIDGIKWMRERIVGEHRHFRLNGTCPACWRTWCQDFTDNPENVTTPIPPPKLGLALLCGVCTAKRRLIYIARSGNRVLWFAPYFTPELERLAWARIRDPQYAGRLARVEDLGPWEEQELPHPRARDARLRDDVRDVCRPITQRYRMRFWEVSKDEASNLEWKIPPAPEGFRPPPVVKVGKGEGSEAQSYD